LRHTYDTNIFISRKPEVFKRSFYLSSVVLTELQSGAQAEEHRIVLQIPPAA